MESTKTNEIKQMSGAIFIFLIVLFLMSQKIQAMNDNRETSPSINNNSKFKEVEKRKYDLPVLFQIN